MRAVVRQDTILPVSCLCQPHPCHCLLHLNLNIDFHYLELVTPPEQPDSKLVASDYQAVACGNGNALQLPPMRVQY